MTAYESILLEGKQEGRKEGKEEVIINIIKKYPKFSDKEISDLTGVNTEVVGEIRTKLNK